LAATAETAFRIGTDNFVSRQDVYNAAVTGDTILIHAGAQTLMLLTSRPIDSEISGGWNAYYAADN
jgi:hypothetical protein